MLIVSNYIRNKLIKLISLILVESRHQWVDSNQMVLYGHRSIVNQVRYNPQRCLLASSGVEKIIKVIYN